MKQRLIFLILLLATMFSVSLQAQTPKLDSLREVLRKDTSSFEVLIELARLLTDVNNVESIAYAKRAKSVSLAQGDTICIVRSSRMVGQLDNRLGNVDSAIRELTFILPVAERNNQSNEVKKILNSLATSFTYKAEYGKALEYHFKSLVLREKEHDKQGIGITLNNIGVVYVASSNYEQGLSYLTRCLRVKEEIQDSLDLDRLYLNLGSCHSEMGNYVEAKAFYDRAMVVCQPHCTKAVLTACYSGLGDCYRHQQRNALAKQYLVKALALSIQDNNSKSHLMCLNKLAQIAIEQNDIISLRDNLLKIESFAGKDQFPLEMQSFYDLSSKYQASIGDFKKAYLLQKKYSELGEIVSNSKVNSKISDVQIRFAERENFQKLLAQEKLLSAQNLAFEKQKIINLLFLALAGLTMLLIFILFKMNQKKAEINKILDQLVKERTFELEQNRIALQHSYDEQSVVLGRVCRDLTSSLATIQGLNNVAGMDHFANSGVYLRAAETTLFRSIQAIRANTISEYSGI